MFKLMLDPGHGGKDPGAVGYGLQEKNIVLSIALAMKSILLNEYENITVRLTRETDVFHELSDRAKMANDWGADYFLSLHVNAGGGSGFESYIHQSRSAQSVQLQGVAHSEIMKHISEVTDRGKKLSNFAVLRHTRMPALLTENLFIDHSHDANKLRDNSFLQKIARGHVNGLEKAFGLKKKAGSQTPEVKQPEQNPTEQTGQADTKTRLAIQKLHQAGIINTPDYWLNHAKQGSTVRGDYAASLLQKMAEKLNEA